MKDIIEFLKEELTIGMVIGLVIVGICFISILHLLFLIGVILWSQPVQAIILGLLLFAMIDNPAKDKVMNIYYEIRYYR